MILFAMAQEGLCACPHLILAPNNLLLYAWTTVWLHHTYPTIQSTNYSFLPVMLQIDIALLPYQPIYLTIISITGTTYGGAFLGSLKIKSLPFSATVKGTSESSFKN